MKKSIRFSMLFFIVAFCAVSATKAMEEYMNIDTFYSPTTKALLDDYQGCIEDALAKKNHAQSVRPLQVLCVLAIIKHNITDLYKIPFELQTLIASDTEYAKRNPIHCKSLLPAPSDSPTKKRCLEISITTKTKHLVKNSKTPPVKKKLFIG